MESLLCEEKVKSQQTTIMVLKCHNFGSNRWITLKVLQNFLEVVFLGVAI
jgi:L-fucose isomerase-like protein